MTPQQREELIASALAARERAYAPYSRFPVGAALLTVSGAIIRGGNVENASYGLTICAERAAVVAALATGEQEFVALAVATAGGHAPCGACRQVLAEFAPELPILLIDADQPSHVTETSLRELFPAQFRLKD